MKQFAWIMIMTAIALPEMCMGGTTTMTVGSQTSATIWGDVRCVVSSSTPVTNTVGATCGIEYQFNKPNMYKNSTYTVHSALKSEIDPGAASSAYPQTSDETSGDGLTVGGGFDVTGRGTAGAVQNVYIDIQTTKDNIKPRGRARMYGVLTNGASAQGLEVGIVGWLKIGNKSVGYVTGRKGQPAVYSEWFDVGFEGWDVGDGTYRDITLSYPEEVILREGESTELLRVSEGVLVSASHAIKGVVLKTGDDGVMERGQATFVRNSITIAAQGTPLGVSKGNVTLTVTTR